MTLLAVDRPVCEEDPAASDLARLCAFLAPDPIPVECFTRAAAELPSSLAGKAADPVAWPQVDRVGQACPRAYRRSWAADAPADRRDHPPFPDASRAGRNPRGRRSKLQLLVAAAPMVTDGPVTWPAWSAILPHLIHLDPATSGNGDLRKLACDATLVLYLRGDYNTGQDLARRLHQAWSGTLGEDDLDTLYAANNLARYLFGLVDYEGARQLDQDTFTPPLPGPRRGPRQHAHVASNLARDLQTMRDYQGARSILEDNLIRRRRIFGEDHPDTLHTASRLAVTLHGLGDYAGAQVLQEDTLTRSRRVLGEDDPDTLRSAGDLAVTLQSLGDHEDARALHEDTLAHRRRVLGKDHPYTLRSADDLAVTLQSLGDHEDARALHEDTLARRRRVLGEDHPETLRSAGHLTLTLCQLEGSSPALDLGEDTLARMRRVPGADHPDTLAMVGALAALREQSGPE